MKYIFIILISLLSVSCNSQEKKSKTVEIDNSKKQNKSLQIGQYVSGVFEDSKGNLWFGTIEKGIAKYDGNVLRYYTVKDGLPSNRVTSVKEDSDGVLWFNTGNGISKYDGQKFTNLNIKQDDILANLVSQFLIDDKGKMWVGTWSGVFQFDGTEFTHFPIPYPKIETTINNKSKDWITEIKEDIEGNIWFSRDGYGIAKYDGISFTHYVKKDGLQSNNVTEIEIDNQNNLWFGMRNGENDNSNSEKRDGKGGVNKLTNKKIISLPEIKAFDYDDIYEIHKDNNGNIWIGTSENGVYKYDGEVFKNYAVPISIMSMEDDKKGNLWLGGAGGLYKIDKNDNIINVTTDGPWE
ncbi:two-component regulator propeller domain-containing protein [Lacinutrix sp.]|uniref:ligand-binding sensor domain-containing protein n=1 Tax=Lacinutrix sp. TaxID=1937692 RepID=UPI0025BC3742|nr:two-component regulator propeller domain-containing protein [Lacinutrix sp.]